MPKKIKLNNEWSYVGEVNGRGMPHGEGTMINKVNTIEHSGKFRDGKRHGLITSYLEDGLKFTGKWKNDQMPNVGLYKFSDGQIYEGSLKDGNYHGRGKLTLPNGNVINAIFNEGDIEKVLESNELEKDSFNDELSNHLKTIIKNLKPKEMSSGLWYFEKPDEKFISNIKADDNLKELIVFFMSEQWRSFPKLIKKCSINYKYKLRSGNNPNSGVKKTLLNWKKLDIEYLGDQGKEDKYSYLIRVLPQLTLKNLKSKFNKSKFLRELINKRQFVDQTFIKAIDADEELEYYIFHEPFDEGFYVSHKLKVGEEMSDGSKYVFIEGLYPKNYSINMMDFYYTGKIFNKLSKDLSFNFLACFGDYTNSDAFGILHSKSTGLSYFISYLSNQAHETWTCDFYGKKKSVIKRALKDITSRNYVTDVPLVFNKEYDWDLKKIIKSYSILYNDRKQTEIETAKLLEEKMVAFSWSMILCSHKDIEASRRNWRQKSIKNKPYHIFN